MTEKKAPREFWIHEWTDSQPDGFLSGNVRHTIAFDVYLHPVAGAFHVIEHSAFKTLQSKCEIYEAALKKIEQMKYGYSHEEYCDIVDKHMEIARQAILTASKIGEGEG